MKIMYGLRISIGIIFDRIGCSKDEYMLDEAIDENSMLKYMSHIERRTNEILQMYETCQNDGFAFEEKKDERPMYDSSTKQDENLERKKDELNRNFLFTN